MESDLKESSALHFAKYQSSIWRNPEYIQKTFSDISFGDYMHPKKSFFTITPHTYDMVRSQTHFSDKLMTMLISSVISNNKNNPTIHIWQNFHEFKAEITQKCTDLKTMITKLQHCEVFKIIQSENINVIIPYRETLIQEERIIATWNFALTKKSNENFDIYFYSPDNKIRSTGNLIFSLIKNALESQNLPQFRLFKMPSNKRFTLEKRHLENSHLSNHSQSGLLCLFVLNKILNNFDDRKRPLPNIINTLFDRGAFCEVLIEFLRKFCKDIFYENQFEFTKDSFLCYRNIN